MQNVSNLCSSYMDILKMQSSQQPYNKNYTPTATEDYIAIGNLPSFILHPSCFSHVKPCQTNPAHVSLTLLWTLKSVYSIHLTISNTFLHFIFITSFNFLCISALHLQLIVSSLRAVNIDLTALKPSQEPAGDIGDISHMFAKCNNWLAIELQKGMEYLEVVPKSSQAAWAWTAELQSC